MRRQRPEPRRERRPRELPQPEPLRERVAAGIARLGTAVRAQAWRAAGEQGLTPTQGQILAQLRARAAPCRLGALAEALAVSAATASDAVQALERKRLVTRGRSARDSRSLAIALTPLGRSAAAASAAWTDFLAEGVSALPAAEQAALLRLVTRLILGLQQRGQIPVAAMCVTCRFFRPHAHPGSLRPHHCAFVDAPFADAALRLECPEHEPAAPAARRAAARAWLATP